MSKVFVMLCAAVCVGGTLFGAVVPGEYWVSPDGKMFYFTVTVEKAIQVKP